jgi:hypothetical protein
MVIKHSSYRAFSKHGSICDYAVLEDFFLTPPPVSLLPILNHFKYGFALAKRSKFYIHPQSWLIVPDSKRGNIPEVVVVWRWKVGVWRGWDSWVKGGANGVSLQAT